MTADEAFKLWAEKHEFDLPWSPNDTEMKDAFMAGWGAKEEAMKQVTMDLEHAPLIDPKPMKNLMDARANCSGAIYQIHGMSEDAKAELIWKAWPIKKARGAAIVAIKKALKKERMAALLIAVDEYAAAIATWKPEDRQFVPMCSTWMNQERWTDDRSTWRRGVAHVSQFSKSH